MTDSHLCACCPTLRPADTPRIPDDPPACNGCRRSVRAHLSEIPDLYALIDIAPGRSSTERVSGSREAPVPLRVDPLDLTLPARQGSLDAALRGIQGDEDQVGHLSVATELDFWVRDWIVWRAKGEHLPSPTVASLTGWLLVRLDDAWNHPAIDEFAAKVSYLRRILLRVSGAGRLIHRLHVPCPSCELMSLTRRDGDSYVECGSCGRLWTEEDYRRLCIVLAAEQEAA